LLSAKTAPFVGNTILSHSRVDWFSPDMTNVCIPENGFKILS
jgi:hypothetical protein